MYHASFALVSLLAFVQLFNSLKPICTCVISRLHVPDYHR